MDNPTIEYLYAAMFILGGMIFYVPFVHYKVRVPFMGRNLYEQLLEPTVTDTFVIFTDGITVFLQMLFEVAPTSTVLFE